MKRENRLNRIAKIKLDMEQEAGRHLANAQNNHRQQEDQLAQLKGYKQDYSQKLIRTDGKSLSGEQLRDYKQFMAKLDAAIEEQNLSIQQSQSQVDHQHSEWLSRHRQTQSISKAAENERSRENKHQDKLEQANNDEYNLRNNSSKWTTK